MEAIENIKPTTSITRQLTLRVLLLTTISAAGVIGIVLLSVWVTLQQVQGQIHNMSDEAANTFTHFILEAQESLLAKSDGLLTEGYSDQDLLSILFHNPAILDVLLLDFDGRILAQRSVAGRARQAEFSNEEWLKTTPAFGEVLVGPVVFEAERPVIDMATLVTDDIGLSGGLLVARLDLTNLWAATLEINVGETGYAYIADETGQLIAFRNRRLIGHQLPDLVNRSPQEIGAMGLDYYRSVNGPWVLASARPIQAVPWFAVVEQPVSEALAPLYVPAIVLFAILIGLGIILYGTIQFTRSRIAQPLGALSGAVAELGRGQFQRNLKVKHQDELGLLTQAFNDMGGQIQELLTTLEDRVQVRTQELETIAGLNERLSAILDVDALLVEIVNQVKARFDYYHAHIYLVDETHDKLVVAAGTGEAGQTMVAHEHSIALKAPASLVARAARRNEVVSVDNVRENPEWLPNELLPDTYSEMAVPIVLDEQVVGVLDVQQDKIAGLDEGDANLLRSLAGQVAVAMRNARLFQQMQAAHAEAEELNRRLTRESWQNIAQQTSTTGYVFFNGKAAPSSTEWLPAMQTAVEQKRLARENVKINGSDSVETNTSMAIPLTLRGQVIGVLGIERPVDREWSEDEMITVQNISEQVSLALDAARLSRETERAAWRDHMVSETTATVWSSAEIEDVMQAAVAQLGTKLRASEVVIRLGTETELQQD